MKNQNILIGAGILALLVLSAKRGNAAPTAEAAPIAERVFHILPIQQEEIPTKYYGLSDIGGGDQIQIPYEIGGVEQYTRIENSNILLRNDAYALLTRRMLTGASNVGDMTISTWNDFLTAYNRFGIWYGFPRADSGGTVLRMI